MKFFGTPNMAVMERNREPKYRKNPFKCKQLLFRFDNNGEYSTTDEALINKLIGKFKHENGTIEPPVASKSMKCKKCDYVTDNKGELLAHYRTEHPKEG
jgi:hypothetical protein